MILRDKYAMYRDYDDPEWEFLSAGKINPSEWTDWDFTLASVLQIIEDYTDKNTGQLMWYDQSDDVDWEVKSSFSGSQAAIERDDRELDPGETLYAVPVFKDGKRPTIHDWIKQLEEDSAHPHGSPNNGHDEWDILDARDEKEKRRKELAEKLKNGA